MLNTSIIYLKCLFLIYYLWCVYGVCKWCVQCVHAHVTCSPGEARGGTGYPGSLCLLHSCKGLSLNLSLVIFWLGSCQEAPESCLFLLPSVGVAGILSHAWLSYVIAGDSNSPLHSKCSYPLSHLTGPQVTLYC